MLGLSAGAVALGLAATPLAGQDGKAVYDKWCAGCHGVDGAGAGPAAGWMLPRPRDFTKALYQIRTTPSGQLPTDADILRVIDEGMPGTAMPGWEAELTKAERDALVAYLKTLSRFFQNAEAPPAIEIGRAPGVSDERLERGRELYQQMECFKCHGEVGRGDGASAPTQEDEDGFPIRPADLAQNWTFNGGGTTEAIYARLRTGLDGTPMPSYADLVDAGVITDDDLWSLAQYVRSLSPEKTPEVRDVVRAGLVEGALPASPEDEAWGDVAAAWIPLVGQIIEAPRWFSPAVTGVWVQALHNGEELALRLSWDDRSESPDPVWGQWQQRVWEVMEPKEGDAPDASLPDQLVVQFPTTMPEGRDLPYFLMGNARSPVYQWRWRSDAAAAADEVVARGLASAQVIGAGAIPAAASFDRGRWQLVLRRSLAGDPEASRIGFPEAQPIPMALFAWDGSNGETGGRAAIGSWYYLVLDQPTPATVYTVPVGATVLTALLGVVVVARAQRRERLGLTSEETDGPTSP